jgi:transcriptional adapter 3
MARQELRNKLQQADNDVMDSYRKISIARSKKKLPTKKERDNSWKALKEREIILKQLESI